MFPVIGRTVLSRTLYTHPEGCPPLPLRLRTSYLFPSGRPSVPTPQGRNSTTTLGGLNRSTRGPVPVLIKSRERNCLISTCHGRHVIYEVLLSLGRNPGNVCEKGYMGRMEDGRNVTSGRRIDIETSPSQGLEGGGWGPTNSIENRSRKQVCMECLVRGVPNQECLVRGVPNHREGSG